MRFDQMNFSETGYAEPAILTVSQLNEYVHGLLGSDPRLAHVRVQGELTGFKRHTSGHLYFSIKDAGGLVRCVMFRSAAQSLRMLPKDGMQVVVIAEASLFVRDGQFQLYVQAMQEQGEGELYRQFLLLKSKLEAKGYFDAAHKGEIPFLPRCVGVITSGTGAALQDILQIIRRRYPGMDVEICPVQVQGAGAAKEIARAIRFMNARDTASVLIVGRGGGSLEDLWAFNEECVAEAIFNSRIPIISAVGHETDYTIADFVSDLRAPTPSAAAELCVPEYAALAQQVDALLPRLAGAYGQAVRIKKEKVSLLLQARGLAVVGHHIAFARQWMKNEYKQLSHNMQSQMGNNKNALQTALIRLEAMAPAQMFSRGFAYISDAEGRGISCVRSLRPGMPVVLNMQDGRATAEVSSITENSFNRKRDSHEGIGNNI